jgi:16S rRNA (cytosine967-C5)-methyltransferase
MSRLVGAARPAAGARVGPATARSVALQALVEIDGSARARANVVLPALLGTTGLSERDRAFATELVYGTVRRQRACDWLAHRHVHRALDAGIRAAVRLGTYQLAFLGTPAHAAVSATVAEVTGPGRGLVNAVLRRVSDDLAGGPIRWPDLATELSYPDWIVAALQEDLGRQPAEAALRAMNEPASMTIRPDGYVQDLASQWVTAAVAGGAGDGQAGMIADLCAAPGGKATGLAYGVRGTAFEMAWPSPSMDQPGAARPLVVALDLDPSRAGVVRDNATRLGLGNVGVVVADARYPPLRPGTFDRVLVDAPCSGLGVLRRRPDARWRIQPADVARLAALQRVLLEAALPLVRPGGLLIYSVCTLTRAETAGIDRWLAEAHPEARPVLPALDPAWERVGRGARLLPQTAGTDGMFLLALRVA